MYSSPMFGAASTAGMHLNAGAAVASGQQNASMAQFAQLTNNMAGLNFGHLGAVVSPLVQSSAAAAGPTAFPTRGNAAFIPGNWTCIQCL